MVTILCKNVFTMCPTGCKTSTLINSVISFLVLAQERGKEMHPLCVCVCVCVCVCAYMHVCISVTQISLKLLHLHVFGKLLVLMHFYAFQIF